jgi:hypothetical protein
MGDWLENATLSTFFGKGSHTVSPPANLYVGLATTDSGQLEASTLTNELPVANGYGRQAIGFRDGDGTALPTTTGTVENDALITFTASGAAWSEVTYLFVIDSASGAGNVLAWGPVAAFTLGDTDAVNFAAGQLVFTLN